MLDIITANTAFAKDIGLLFMRIGVGTVFCVHGYKKLVGGHAEWLWTGQQMKNLGISFWPIFWGLCATAAELLDGISILLGLGIRILCPFMAFTMLVAVMHHIAKGDSWGYISHPLVLMFVFLGFTITGAGLYSLDALLI